MRRGPFLTRAADVWLCRNGALCAGLTSQCDACMLCFDVVELVFVHTVDHKHNPDFKKFDTNIEGFQTAIYHTDSIEMSLSYNARKAENYEEIKNYDISEYNR